VSNWAKQNAARLVILSSPVLIVAFWLLSEAWTLRLSVKIKSVPSKAGILNIALLLGWCGPLLKHAATLADCVAPARAVLHGSGIDGPRRVVSMVMVMPAPRAGARGSTC
jgi:hypothetical protein